MTGVLDCGDFRRGLRWKGTAAQWWGRHHTRRSLRNHLVYGAGAVNACWMLESPSSTAI